MSQLSVLRLGVLKRAITRRRTAMAVVVVVLAFLAVAVSGRMSPEVAAIGVVGVPMLAGLIELGRELRGLQRSQRTLFQKNRAVLVETTAALAEVRELAKVADRVERTERRILAAVETERVASADRHRRLTKVTANLVSTRKLGDIMLIQNHQQTREVEALLQLYRGFEPRSAMPSAGRWALNPSDLLAVLGHLERRRPALVVELGSGTSTVWIAYALQRLGGRIVSIDHDPVFGGQTRAQLAAHGLTGVAEVRDAPLRTTTVGGEPFEWYDEDAFAGLDGIEVLLIDGPPKTIGSLARFPALPVLAGRLADDAVVLLDDAGRPDEQEALSRWLDGVPGLSRKLTGLGQHAELHFKRPGAAAPDQRRGEVATV